MSQKALIEASLNNTLDREYPFTSFILVTVARCHIFEAKINGASYHVRNGRNEIQTIVADPSCIMILLSNE